MKRILWFVSGIIAGVAGVWIYQFGKRGATRIKRRDFELICSKLLTDMGFRLEYPADYLKTIAEREA